ncbi:hypothetical protein PROFUN_16994, partial [Planoprotostelium fungivorum]
MKYTTSRNSCEGTLPQRILRDRICCAQHLTSLMNWKTRRNLREISATKKHIQCTFIERELLGFLWFEIILYKQRLIELFGSYVNPLARVITATTSLARVITTTTSLARVITTTTSLARATTTISTSLARVITKHWCATNNYPLPGSSLPYNTLQKRGG